MPKSEPSAWRVIWRISSRSADSLSGTWRCLFQAMTRNQPSPNGAMNAKPARVALTVRMSGGGSARLQVRATVGRVQAGHLHALDDLRARISGPLGEQPLGLVLGRDEHEGEPA